MNRDLGLPAVSGILGEGLFIFRELGCTGNYFQGFGKQIHSFRDLARTQYIGSEGFREPRKKVK